MFGKPSQPTVRVRSLDHLGQENDVVVKRLAVEDIIEERMFRLQDVKIDTPWPELVPCNNGVNVFSRVGRSLPESERVRLSHRGE